MKIFIENDNADGFQTVDTLYSKQQCCYLAKVCPNICPRK